MRPSLHFVIALFGACIVCPAHADDAAPRAPGAGVPATQPSVSDAQFDAAMEFARTSLQGPAFDAAVRSVAPRFPVVNVCTEPGMTYWTKVTLNRRGKQVDAFRFRVPDDQPRDLVWAMLSNETRYEWHILAVDGEPMRGFSRNWYYKPQDVLGQRAPRAVKDLMFQSLPAAHLRPGAEYLIWLKVRHANPRPTYVALNLVPAAADPATIDAPDYIVRTLGLSPAGEQIDAIAVDLTPSTQPSPMPGKPPPPRRKRPASRSS